MPDKVLIFGKDAGPYTRAARAAFAKDGRQVDYYDVVKETRHLETMLEYSKGTRKVPIIVEGETVTIGFEGDTGGIGFFRLEAGYEGRMSNVKCGIRKVDWRVADVVNIKKYRIVSSMHYPPKARVK